MVHKISARQLMHRLTAGESPESLWLALEGTSVSHPSCRGSGSITEWKAQRWGRGAMKQRLLDVRREVCGQCAYKLLAAAVPA